LAVPVAVEVVVMAIAALDRPSRGRAEDVTVFVDEMATALAIVNCTLCANTVILLNF